MGIGLNDTRVEVDNALYMELGYFYPKRKKAIGKCSGIVDVEVPFTCGSQCLIETSIEKAQKQGNPQKQYVCFGNINNLSYVNITYLVPRLDLSGHTAIGTEHLLMGLLLPNGGLAIDVLEELGVDPSDNLFYFLIFISLF